MNAKDMWLKQVKHHRKRLKGLPRVGFNPNAGNVEHNISMMNKMLNVGEISNNPISGPFGGEVSAPAGDGAGMAMGESLNEALQTDTAYMLRNDGKVFKLEEIHPYVMNINTQPTVAIRSLINNPDDLLWFYKNTAQEELKDLIKSFIKKCLQVYRIYPDTASQLKKLFGIDHEQKEVVDDAIDLIIKINNSSNQEFCRVRTSHESASGLSDSKDIYFRVSSQGFNWFNLIWNLVYANRKWIKSITIESDFESKGDSIIYIYNNHSFDHMETSEFINLKGNPIIESTDILLTEAKRSLSPEVAAFLRNHKEDFIENDKKNWISIYADAYVTYEESFIPRLTELILSMNKVNPLDKLNYVPEHYAEGLDQINLDPNDHTLTLGEHISGIGTAAFQSCQLLSEVTILEGCTTIGDSAFRGCPNLTEITLPGSIKYIDKNAFADCWQLRDVYYNGTIEDWEKIRITSYFKKGSDFDRIHCLDDDLILYDGGPQN